MNAIVVVIVRMRVKVGRYELSEHDLLLRVRVGVGGNDTHDMVAVNRSIQLICMASS